MSRRRGAPQGGAPSHRRTGRNRRRQDVYAYVEGGTEHDYLRHLNSQFGGDLVWVFFDRDDNAEVDLVRVHDRAAHFRVNVAFSHPCFEL